MRRSAATAQADAMGNSLSNISLGGLHCLRKAQALSQICGQAARQGAARAMGIFRGDALPGKSFFLLPVKKQIIGSITQVPALY